ncbi:hypothetical protein KBY29_21770 [Ruegeria pomeroyi]|nr:hypothetical protein [Ruegeria pomeroyi]
MKKRIRRLRDRAIRKSRVLMARRFYKISAGPEARILLFLAQTGLRFRPSTLLAAAQIHILYSLNRLGQLSEVCWQIAMGPDKYHRSQIVLHMLLKSSWLLKDMALLNLVLDRLGTTTMTLNNSAFIGLRRGAVPAMRSVVAIQQRRSLVGLVTEMERTPRNTARIDSYLETLDQMESYNLSEVWIRRIESLTDSAIANRFMGRVSMQQERWQQAWDHFDKALTLSPRYMQVYTDMGETALYLENPLDRIAGLLARRQEADVQVRGYDRLRGLKYMLEANDREFYFLRGDQISCEVAFKTYGARARHSMGRGATALPKSGGKAFVIARDGVSDEVRWSFFYKRLLSHYKSVSISCDPRLESLLTRSYPEISFFPVSRNWGRMQQTEHAIPRDNIPHLELAGRLDDVAFAESMTANEVMFIEDVANRTWITDGVNGSPKEGLPRGATLIPKADRVAYWADELKSRMRDPSRLRVGLIWRSSLIDADRKRHYMQLEDFEPLLDHPVEFFSIQHLVNDTELETGQAMGVHFLNEDVDFYDDFEEIAAVTAALDLVIGISTLPYELAGAVGTECWVCAISPAGRWMRLGVEGELHDRLTRNGLTFFPRNEGGYVAPRAERVDSIISQISPRLAQLARERKAG